MNKKDRFSDVELSRSIPFWSWNDDLNDDKLGEQIEWMKKCNIGGFFMHARGGLKTEYLGKDWFDRIRYCVKKAKEEGMTAWAYDENGWPSGFVGGKLLEEEENLENFLETSFGLPDENALVSYDISGAKLVRLTKGERAENCLNVYKRTAVSSVDILDEKVVKKFIDLTHERYKKELGEDFSSLGGFFTDEPQFCRRALLYPHVIAQKFKEEYGEDLLDGLGLLFVEKEGYELFRYRYYKLCQKLMLNAFSKQIYDWCEKNGVRLTGHYIEERDLYTQMLYCAGIMPFYEYEHIPGIDWLCKRYLSVVLARQLGSVCAQLGKKEALTETFAMTGWNATPQELKSIAEFQYFYGVNKTCQHLLPYSERGERKNDYPTHFTPANPWIGAAFDRFNGYFNKLGGILRAGKEQVNVAVFHTVRSAYLNYKKGNFNTLKSLNDSFVGVSETLAKSGVGFHYIDETLLEKHGFVRGNKIGVGLCEYEYLVFPECYTVDKSTDKLLRQFVAGGGKVLLTSTAPYLVEAQKADLSYLKSNVTFDEIKQAQPYKLSTDGDRVYPVYYNFDGFDLLLVMNADNFREVNGEINAAGGIYEYDISSGEETPSNGKFRLSPLGSKAFVIVKGEKRASAAADNKKMVVFKTENFRVASATDNCLVLDYAKYSFDGKNYSEPAFISGIFDEMLKKRYEGDLYLKFDFKVKDIPEKASVLSEYENAEITVNGEKAEYAGDFTGDRNMRLYDLAGKLKKGGNEIRVKIRFYEKESVYYALFGEGVTESLRNCLVYDTYLEALRVLGDFAVYSDDPFISAREKDVVLGENFYIGAKKEVVRDLTTDGYPFFAGKITLKETVYLTETDVMLKFLGKIHFAKVFVNGKKAGELLFNDSVDISSVAKTGENQVEIEIYTGLRNFYGPHHHAAFDEVGIVGPGTFTLAETWKNLKSIYERKSYSLVKQGVFKPNDKEFYQL